MSLSDQERAIRERAAREGWSLTDEDLYVDHGVSGALADRPALTALTGNLDRYDVLCVWSLDRLGRDLPQMLNNVQQLTSEGVEIVSLSDPVDLTSAAGEFQFNVGAAVAAFERKRIGERTRASMPARAKAGKHLRRGLWLPQGERHA